MKCELYIGELVDPQSDRGDPKPSVSFTDLVTRVASLTTKIPELVSESQNVSRAVDRIEQEMKRYAGEAADLQRQMREYSLNHAILCDKQTDEQTYTDTHQRTNINLLTVMALAVDKTQCLEAAFRR